MRKKKCDYYKCKGLAVKKIETKLDRELYVLNVCEECYDEYLESMEMMNE